MANITAERRLQEHVTRAWTETKRGIQQLAGYSDSDLPGRVVSASLIGPQVESRPIERTMDLDLLLITHENPSAAFICRLRRVFESVQNAGSSCLDIQYALKDGPMKPPAYDRPVLFLHVLLHSVRSYRESPLTLVKRSWETDAQPFIGIGPGLLERSAPVSRDELLRSAIGILDCYDLLQRLQTPYLEWRIGQSPGEPVMCLDTQPVTEDLTVVETAIYCTLRCASNACRWLVGHSASLGIKANAVNTFESLFGAEGWASTPRDAYITKTLLRTGRITASPQLAATWQSRALEFLERLRACIETIPSEPARIAVSRSPANHSSKSHAAPC